MNQSLTLRNKAKSKKPEFEMQNVNVYPQNKGRWRFPRGLHSKMRNAFRGNPIMPSIGWGSPRDARGLLRDGSKGILVENLKQVEKLNKDEVAILAANVGLKKRVLLLSKLKEKGIRVYNVKDVNLFIENVKKNLDSKKQDHKKRDEKKTKSQLEIEKKAAEKEKKPEEKQNESKK